MSIVSLPLRLATGAFILNSGVGKLNLPTEAYEGMRDMGAAGVPALKDISADQFGQALSYGEIALGAALLFPKVPNWLAGAGLGAFSLGLLNMYRNTPGMTVDGIRPTQEGTGVAKDVFMLGSAAAMILDSVTDTAHNTAKATRRAAKKAAKKVK